MDMDELTRRQFLQLLAIAGGTAAVTMATGCTRLSPEGAGEDGAVNDMDGSGDATTPDAAPEPATELLACFMLLSDTHITHDNPVRAERLAAALEQIDAFDPRPDAVIVNGDITNGSRVVEYDQFFEVANASAFEYGRDLLTTCGNHDQLANNEGSQEEYDYVRGLWMSRMSVPMYYDRMVAGQHLILMGPDGIGGWWDRFNITSEQVAWVERLVEADEAAGINSLIFCHEPLPSTVYGTDEGQWGFGASIENPEELEAMLRRHPQVVFITGHTHVVPDVRRRSDAEPTFVNEGSCGYSYDPRGGFRRENPLSNGVEMKIYADRYEFRFRDFLEKTWGNVITIKH